MPLIKRAVSPVDVSRGRIPPGLQNDELQCVANGTLANLIRQLSSLSKHAEHIFGEIYLEAMKLEHKSNVLEQRIERVRSKVSQLDSNNEQATLGEVQMRKAFKSSMLVDQHTLDRSTLPVSLTEAYTRCDRPPNLDALNPYRDDPSINALTLYTNPSFFFDLWRQEMLKDVDTKRRVKSPTDGNKSPKKKRRAVPQQETNKQVSSRYTNYTRAPLGALSFPEEYQAPQALGLQLNRPQNQYQQFQANSSLLPPPGMSVHAPPMDNKPQLSTAIKRDLPPPDLSLLSIDDDDDLPPPPPPLMHTSIVQQIPSPPQNNIQFVQSDNQVVPPPPPPPPPPLLMFPSTNAATFATSSGPIEEKQKEEQKPDPRSDLLSQIRKGLELKKVRRAEEEEAERVATEQNDVAAILKRRMEHVLGNEDDSQSSECDDDEWED